SMSISPDCSAVKRCGGFKGTNFTLEASPNTAAATARQTSTSRPCHSPLLSVPEKPGAEVFTPHTTWSLVLTESSTLPACAAPPAATAMPRKAVERREVVFILVALFIMVAVVGQKAHSCAER